MLGMGRTTKETHTLRVMDSSGDRSVTWDLSDAKAMREAEAVFNKIKRGGQVFYAQPDGNGGGVVGRFDPHADMIAVPIIVGG